MTSGANTVQTAREGTPGSPLWIRIGFWICILIAIAAVLRRLVALAAPSTAGPPEMTRMDAVFASHTALTLAHIVPALLFVLLAPVIVFRRTGRPGWIDGTFYALGAIVGVTAYGMSAYPIGGRVEQSAVLVFDSLFLFSLLRAFNYRHRDPALERRWQLRSLAVLLGIATTRPVVGVFFATSRLTHLVPGQFFGIAFWVGFSINVLVFELWIRSVDRRLHRLRKSAEFGLFARPEGRRG